MNINTQKYWDDVYKSEGLNTWRKYPYGFMLIRKTFQKPCNVLELGCGMGVLMRQLKADGHSVIGLDISKHAVTKLRRTGLRARQFDVTTDNWQDLSPSYDAIVCTEFLEHFDNEQLAHILRNTSQKCGILVGIVPDQMLPPEEFPEHEQCFDKDTLTTLLLNYYDNVQVSQFTEQFEKSAAVGIKLNCLYFLAQKTGGTQ